MGKRMVGLFAAFALLFSGVLWRVSWVGMDRGFAQAANRQSSFLLEVTKSKGTIYDCEGKPLNNDTYEYLAAVLPSNEAAQLLKDQFSSPAQLQQQMQQKAPFLYPVGSNEISGEGIRVFSVPVRYSDNYTAAHVVGYVDQQGVGVSGIERAFDSFLSKVGLKIQVRYQVDAVGRAFPGSEPEVLAQGNMTDGVVLTLHKQL